MNVTDLVPLDEWTSLRGAGHAVSSIQYEGSLRRLYEAYCQHQASALLRLIPREGLRPLYRIAREWPENGGESVDPLDILVRYCRHILPLPPYADWLADFSGNRTAHLEQLDRSPSALSSGEPVVIEVLQLSHGESAWNASLELFREGPGWRGYISFHESAAPADSVRTADIFCERDPLAIRERFLSFEEETLRAFLRSALP